MAMASIDWLDGFGRVGWVQFGCMGLANDPARGTYGTYVTYGRPTGDLRGTYGGPTGDLRAPGGAGVAACGGMWRHPLFGGFWTDLANVSQKSSVAASWRHPFVAACGGMWRHVAACRPPPKFP